MAYSRFFTTGLNSLKFELYGNGKRRYVFTYQDGTKDLYLRMTLE